MFKHLTMQKSASGNYYIEFADGRKVERLFRGDTTKTTTAARFVNEKLGNDGVSFGLNTAYSSTFPTTSPQQIFLGIFLKEMSGRQSKYMGYSVRLRADSQAGRHCSYLVGGYISLRSRGAQNYSALSQRKLPSFSVHAVLSLLWLPGIRCQSSRKSKILLFPGRPSCRPKALAWPMPKQAFSTEGPKQKTQGCGTALLEIHERACDFFQECLRRAEAHGHASIWLGRGPKRGPICRAFLLASPLIQASCCAIAFKKRILAK